MVKNVRPEHHKVFCFSFLVPSQFYFRAMRVEVRRQLANFFSHSEQRLRLLYREMCLNITAYSENSVCIIVLELSQAFQSFTSFWDMVINLRMQKNYLKNVFRIK